jgi:hypothetical protein
VRTVRRVAYTLVHVVAAGVLIYVVLWLSVSDVGVAVLETMAQKTEFFLPPPGDPWLRIPTLLLVLLGAGWVARRAWREIPLVVPSGASCCCWPLAVAYLSWTSFVMPMRPSTCSAPAPMPQAHLYRVDQHSRHVGTQRTAVALPAYQRPVGCGASCCAPESDTSGSFSGAGVASARSALRGQGHSEVLGELSPTHHFARHSPCPG